MALLYELFNLETEHSAPSWNLMKFQIPKIKTMQGEQVCLKDSKNILFEILANRTWKGCTSSCWPSQPNRACSAGRSLYGPSMSYVLGFQTKHIWNRWGILVHPAQLILLYLSTLLDSWLAHCDTLLLEIYTNRIGLKAKHDPGWFPLPSHLAFLGLK